MSKVSVLVAAYNSEPYITKCMDSLLTQTLHDIEVICVDDASTDNTPSILDDYAKKDERVIVKHLKENVGQAKARNVGLAMSSGDYVCMLDSDDWFSNDALMSALCLFEQHPETDCVLFQVDEVYTDHVRRYPMPDFEVISGIQAFEDSLDWTIHGLYMTRGVIHRQIPFDDTTRSYSDDNTTRLHFLQSREVRQCDGIYFYRQHEESVTHRIDVGRFDYLRANESMLRQMKEAKVSQVLIDKYENVRWLNMIGTYMFYFENRHKLNAKNREYGLREIHRVWKEFDTSALCGRLKWKFGYMPLQPFWHLFKAQEDLYFGIRTLLHRI